MKVTLDESVEVSHDTRIEKHFSAKIKLGRNFNLSEFTISQVAERYGYKNEPNEKEIENLGLLCQNVLQPLWDRIGTAIFINSGFRSVQVNAAVGGKSNSQHLEGKAADFIVPVLDLHDVFQLIQVDFHFDQLIFEFGKWIHVSWNGDLNRNEVLLSKKVYGKTVYERING